MNEQKNLITNAFKFALLAVIAVISLGMFVGIAMDRSEISSCRQWESQSKEYAGFYLLEWQAEQCSHHNIFIDAPTR